MPVRAWPEWRKPAPRSMRAMSRAYAIRKMAYAPIPKLPMEPRATMPMPVRRTTFVMQALVRAELQKPAPRWTFVTTSAYAIRKMENAPIPSFPMVRRVMKVAHAKRAFALSMADRARPVHRVHRVRPVRAVAMVEWQDPAEQGPAVDRRAWAGSGRAAEAAEVQENQVTRRIKGAARVRCQVRLHKHPGC